MIFSYNWLQDYIKQKLPKPERLAQLLTMHSFEVEQIRKIGQDFALDIKVTPNRADCFSHLGVARECWAILNSRLQMPNAKLEEKKDLKAKDFVKVEVRAKRACPRYTARVITDVRVGSSPKWIKERLKVCGLQSINNIVDIANYVMLETGQPLHAFDLEKIEKRKIIVRFAKKGEKIITLDNKKYDLDENILIIADFKKPIGIAGIKGELTTGIDKKTKTIVLEAANFDRLAIGRGSKILNLISDASLRFEHGIDPNLTEMAIDRAAYLIGELASGKIAQGLVDFYPKKVFPKRIRLDLDYVEKLSGVKIPAKEIKNILKRLGFKIKAVDVKHQQVSLGFKVLEVEIPTFRRDISIPEDLIEEIGRIYGYEKIKAIFPKAALIPPKRNLEIFWEEFSKDVLKEAGFSEVYNYCFLSQADLEIFGYKRREILEIENPISENLKYLRPSLICNLLKNVKENFRYFDEIKIFELGKIFKKEKNKSKKEQKIIEKRALSGLIAQKKTDEIFYELKGIIDVLLEKMGISNFWYDQFQPTPEESKILIWNVGKCAEIKVDHEEIGFLGEISKRVLEPLKIKGKAMAFDLDFEKLQKLASEEHEYMPISPYPAAVRDLAVLVPRGVLVEDVLNIIESAGGPLIRDVDLFDIYEGEEIPEGKKNLAFHLIYQAEDRTLKSEEIDEIQKKIIEALERNSEWEVRK